MLHALPPCAALLLLTACAAHRAPHARGPHPCPDPEARVEWLRIRSAHLELQTDLTAPEAEALARGLESVWAVQDRMLGPWRTDLPVRRTVLRDGSAFLRLPHYHDLGALEALLFGAPEVAPATADALEQGAHPAARAVAESRLHAQAFGLPPWLWRGLRDYLGALAPQRTGDVRAGQMLPEHLRALQGRAPYPRGLLGGGVEPLDAALEDASAWAWVHYLVAAYPDRMVTLLRAATELPFEDAWALAFAGVDAEALDRAVQRHVAAMPHGPVRLRRVPATGTFELESLEAADVHLAHAEQRAVQAEAYAQLDIFSAAGAPDDGVRAALRASARAEADAALRLEPDHLRARVLREHLAERPDARVLLSLHSRLRAAEETGAAGPDPDATWVLLLDALVRAPAASSATRAPVFLAAAGRGRGSLVLATAAAWLARHGHAAEALVAAERAEVLNPESVFVQRALSRVLLVHGRCAAARTALRRAEVRAGWQSPEARALRRRLDARCPPAATPPGTGIPPPRR